jgi:hypothetical protein
MFTFPGSLTAGAAFAVSLDTQPSGPVQTCTIANGTGNVGTSNVTNVNITCVTPTVSRAWQTAIPLESGNAALIENQQIAVNSHGVAALAWRRMTSEPSEVFASRYSPDTGQWSAPVLIGPDTSSETTGSFVVAPQVAIDDAGNIVVVWNQRFAGVLGVWSNQYTVGTGWGTAVLIDSSPASTTGAHVTFDSNDNVVVAWVVTDGTINHIWTSRRPVSGSAWSPASRVDTSAGTAFGPQLEADGRGNALLVWAQRDDPDVLAGSQIWSSSYVASTGSWNAPVPVETAANVGAFNEQLGYNANGAAFVLWSQNDNSVWSNRYSVETGWGTPVQVGTSGESVDGLAIAADALGNAVAVWDSNSASDSHIWYAVYATGNGWGIATQLSHTLAPATTDGATEPKVAFDASGHALAMWSRFDGMHMFNTSSLYTPGQGWGVPVDIAPTNDPLSVALAVAPDGEAFAAWQQLDSDGNNSSLWTSRFE